MELSERKQIILAAVVEQFIQTGEPVGSKGLQASLPISVSSATIRNEMSELAEMGYLEQPHTSAGRIPSQKGYRYYVDHLMNRREPDDYQRRQMEADIAAGGTDPQRLIEKAGEVLAQLTNCAAMSTMPKGEGVSIRRVEVVPVGGKTCMTLLLTSAGIIRSRVCRLDFELTAPMLENFYNVVSSALLGRPVSEVGAVMLQTLAASLGSEALPMLPLIAAVAELARDADETDVMLEGQSNLLNHREYNGKVYELLEFLNKPQPLGHLIASSKNELDVLIGKESLFRQLEDSSIILARYNIGLREGGAIGLIGPTRIDYARIIPSVEYLTGLLGKLLKKALEE